MARSNEHKKMLNHIIRSKGIYNYRWGCIIRYYVVNLLLASQKSLKGCLYKHSDSMILEIQFKFFNEILFKDKRKTLLQ